MGDSEKKKNKKRLIYKGKKTRNDVVDLVNDVGNDKLKTTWIQPFRKGLRL